MKGHPIEDRLRDALDAHAETFSASPDAWQRVQRKSEVRGGPRRSARAGWVARHSAFVIPAAAAATVAALALGATTLAHDFSAGRSNAPRPATATHAPVPAKPDFGKIMATDPAISAIFGLPVTRNITTWNWIGQPSPEYWFPYIATRPEACHVVSEPGAGDSGSCWPVPTLNAARPAVVIASDYPGQLSSLTISGLAEPAVTSVTEILRDGQRISATIGTGRGFGLKAWSVRCPTKNGTKLVFAGADGRVITTLNTAAPAGPIVLDVPRPGHGGVTMFSYPASQLTTGAGSVTTYLIDQHVAFFSSAFFRGSGTFSPFDASGRPAVGGMAVPFGYVCAPGCRVANIKAFGYAHGDVPKVSVRLPGGGQVVANTYPAGWPGSDLRLWQVTLPDSVWPANVSQPDLIATGETATGLPIAQAALGQPQM